MTQQKHYPHYIDLEPVMHVEGVVRLPGSKSISNRTCCWPRWPKAPPPSTTCWRPTTPW